MFLNYNKAELKNRDRRSRSMRKFRRWLVKKADDESFDDVFWGGIGVRGDPILTFGDTDPLGLEKQNFMEFIKEHVYDNEIYGVDHPNTAIGAGRIMAYQRNGILPTVAAVVNDRGEILWSASATVLTELMVDKRIEV